MSLELASSVLIYGLVIFAIVTKGIQRELLDMNCPEGPDTKDKSVCKDGNGKLWAGHKFTKSDTPRTSLAKISTLNQNYGKAVIWRRCIILSFVATILIFLVTLKRLPSGFELLGSMLVIFMVFYVANGFYRYHHDSFIEEAITEHLKHLGRSLRGSK